MKNYLSLLLVLCPAMAMCAEKNSDAIAKRFVNNILELRANGNPTPFDNDIEAFKWHCDCNELAKTLADYTKPLNDHTLTNISSITEMSKALQPTLPAGARSRYIKECQEPLHKALYTPATLWSKGDTLNYPMFEYNSKYNTPAEERRTILALATFAKTRDACVDPDAFKQL